MPLYTNTFAFMSVLGLIEHHCTSDYKTRNKKEKFKLLNSEVIQINAEFHHTFSLQYIPLDLNSFVKQCRWFY